MKEKGSKYSEYGELLRDSIKVIEEAKDSLKGAISFLGGGKNGIAFGAYKLAAIKEKKLKELDDMIEKLRDLANQIEKEAEEAEEKTKTKNESKS
uniref:Uncharacterized protein n=1 Tax=Dictyoglomus turgidum TaxID=513050 RepID=A0A7C3SR95_9BACT